MDRVPWDHLGLVCYDDEARKGTARPKYVEKSLRKEKSTTTNSHQGRHMGVVATTYVLIAKVHEVTDGIYQISKDWKYPESVILKEYFCHQFLKLLIDLVLPCLANECCSLTNFSSEIVY